MECVQKWCTDGLTKLTLFIDIYPVSLLALETKISAILAVRTDQLITLTCVSLILATLHTVKPPYWQYGDI